VGVDGVHADTQTIGDFAILHRLQSKQQYLLLSGGKEPKEISNGRRVRILLKPVLRDFHFVQLLKPRLLLHLPAHSPPENASRPRFSDTRYPASGQIPLSMSRLIRMDSMLTFKAIAMRSSVSVSGKKALGFGNPERFGDIQPDVAFEQQILTRSTRVNNKRLDQADVFQ